MNDERFNAPPRNGCSACHQDFSSIEAFDRHRVGKHEYTYEEGLELGVEDGRRCLNAEELLGMGWTRDERGRWYDPLRSARASKLRESAAQAE